MRILVIGGTRFIGPAVVRRLHGMGHHVTVLHRGETESADLPAIPHLHGDRLREGADLGNRLLPVVTGRFPLHHDVEGRRTSYCALELSAPCRGVRHTTHR
jgi:nucleoside-diphosphate-sugar epimerase